MPVDLRAQPRYPETLFSVQSNIYRAYHMMNRAGFLQQGRHMGPGTVYHRAAERARAGDPDLCGGDLAR